MRICHSCGTEVSDTAKFCRKCGAKLEPLQAPEGAEGFGQDAERRNAPAFEGDDYQWGPPTGAPEDYDKQAMPPVYVGGSEREASEEGAETSSYTYRVEAPEWDHTDEFEDEDVSKNKVIALAAYLLDTLGVIIALLAGKDSPYAAFHMRQALKFVVVEALLAIVAVLLCWTLIVPAACGVMVAILWVVKVICFVEVCKGRSIEPAIIRSLGFLK